jgi:hypothetical protein
MNITFCGKCGELVFTWSKFCPHCLCNLDEWESGIRIKHNCRECVIVQNTYDCPYRHKGKCSLLVTDRTALTIKPEEKK